VDDLIEIRYAGMVVAKSAAIRNRDAAGFFIAVNDPMPVGTYVSLKINDQPKHARVDQVVESTDALLAGMRLRFVDSVPARAPGPIPARPIPVAPTVAPPAPVPAAAAPLAEVAPSDDETGVTEAEGGGEAAGGGAGEGGGEASPASAGGSGGGRRRRRRR
jgi:hypothetical protein